MDGQSVEESVLSTLAMCAEVDAPDFLKFIKGFLRKIFKTMKISFLIPTKGTSEKLPLIFGHIWFMLSLKIGRRRRRHARRRRMRKKRKIGQI